jgi:protein-S-isoprenylcysteine O-methyltransferase Ste14
MGSVGFVVGLTGFEPTTPARKSDPSRSVSIPPSEGFLLPILLLAHMISRANGYLIASKGKAEAVTLAQMLSQRQNKPRVVPEIDNKRLRAAGIKSLLLICVMLVLQMILFFISAGHVVGPRPWTFFGASFVHYTISTAVLYKLNPELLVERLKRKREGSKLWDEILMRVSNLLVLIAIPVVTGLDIGRFQWLEIGVQFVALGFAFFITSTVLITWAMAVNPHFEATVRIQKNRGHKLISSGPYKIVRHPGYLAGILYTLSIPLIIGSAFAFIPVGIYAILFIIRTSLEDRTLHKELDGYSEYAKRVKHKLFPGIW